MKILERATSDWNPFLHFLIYVMLVSKFFGLIVRIYICVCVYVYASDGRFDEA